MLGSFGSASVNHPSFGSLLLNIMFAALSDGMPLCDLGTACESPTLRYARVMYSAGHGLAPWTLLTSHPPHTWPRNGVMIGDVGYLDKSKGTFRYLFNIFHDSKEPGDLSGKFPDNFVPIQPPFQEWEVQKTPDFFEKGTAITSEGIVRTHGSDSETNPL